jgi:hypothetical protein
MWGAECLQDIATDFLLQWLPQQSGTHKIKLCAMETCKADSSHLQKSTAC